MSNKSKPLRYETNNEIEDINVISHYPKELSDEMVVLVRRITYLKTKLQNVTESQLEVLNDVSDFEDFITHLFLSKRMTVGEFFKTTDPYHPFLKKEYDDDDFLIDNDDEDESEVVTKKSKKKKSK